MLNMNQPHHNYRTTTTTTTYRTANNWHIEVVEMKRKTGFSTITYMCVLFWCLHIHTVRGDSISLTLICGIPVGRWSVPLTLAVSMRDAYLGFLSGAGDDDADCWYANVTIYVCADIIFRFCDYVKGESVCFFVDNELFCFGVSDSVLFCLLF